MGHIRLGARNANKSVIIKSIDGITSALASNAASISSLHSGVNIWNSASIDSLMKFVSYDSQNKILRNMIMNISENIK